MDNLDYGILDLLRQNARAGYGDIGEKVGLSASAVKRRVDRLVTDPAFRAACRAHLIAGRATCRLFDTAANAAGAARTIAAANPGWWVVATTLAGATLPPEQS